MGGGGAEPDGKKEGPRGAASMGTLDSRFSPTRLDVCAARRSLGESPSGIISRVGTAAAGRPGTGRRQREGERREGAEEDVEGGACHQLWPARTSPRTHERNVPESFA